MSQYIRCDVCTKQKDDGLSGTNVKIRACAGCRSAHYCSSACQKKDWPSHKKKCKAVQNNGLPETAVWYDRYRRCKDGSIHEGKLELITWDSPTEDLGWGACLKEESADLKQLFEAKYKSEEEKFFKYWPQGFRWTCCGTDADMSWGCDHHGTGKNPCTCDFCRMGKPLPANVYNKKSASRIGLNLPRGPDPRSYNAAHAALAASGRALMGMDI